MFQLTSYLVLIALVILVLKVRNSPGVALGLAWSTFAMEQVLQQAFPILMRHGMFVNFAIAALVAYAVACSRLRSNERLVPPPRPSLALYALLLLCVLSLGWSAAPVSSAAQLHKFAPYLILFVGITPFCATESSSITTAIKVTVYFGGLIALNLAFCDFGTRSVVLELADGRSVSQAVGQIVAGLGASKPGYVGESGYSLLGAVVGATKSADDGARLRARMADQFMLVPGVGAQGGTAEEVRPLARNSATGPGTLGVVVNASRSVLYPKAQPGQAWQGAVRQAGEVFAASLRVIGS